MTSSNLPVQTAPAPQTKEQAPAKVDPLDAARKHLAAAREALGESRSIATKPQ